ncbi:MAG: hypothetical protein KKC51_08450 [Verrucomicrobia bacterium]|nr:hypothetical protein [Verrucomicrobiota bacterium]
MKRRWPWVLLTAALVLGFCEILARWALPDVPGSLEENRNPFRFRGWPEYIRDVGRGPKGATVVLISNSQAYAGDYLGRQTYPARLEEMLKGRRVDGRTDWQVLNWSSDGMTSIEYVLLARYLQLHPPSLILAVTGFADYSLEHANRGFLHCRTDLPRLVGRPAILTGLPRSYLKRHGRIEDGLAFAVYDRVALYRLKEYFWSWLDVRLPGIHEMFYAPAVNYRPWHLKGKAWLPEMELPRPPQGEIQFTYDRQSGQMLAEFLDGLKDAGVPVVIVAQPRRALLQDERAQWDAAFIEDLRAQTDRRALPLWDMRDALPNDEYLTSSHLKPPNHQRMAELLCDRLEPFLARTP